jgi:thiamine pyrophosphate-dependent acetolactate synthase large subunit-like protein
LTLSEFADMFALLAVQLRQIDADEAVIRSYYEALRELEPEFLKAAARRLSLQAEWFPKTSEWRAAAEAIRRERIEAQRRHLRRASRPLCRVCDDTGWESVDVVERGRSIRRVTPCACREQRRRELLGHAPPPALPPAIKRPDREAAQG